MIEPEITRHRGSDEEPKETTVRDTAVDVAGKDTDLAKVRGEAKKNGGNGNSYAVVCVRAKAFLEAIHDGTLARLKREELYLQLAEVVFSYWAARLHHPAAILDGKRERRLLARLRESRGDWGLLCYAIDGALSDDWLMGRAMNSARKYDGIETIFRDRAQVERLAEMSARFRAGEPHDLVKKYEQSNA